MRCGRTVSLRFSHTGGGAHRGAGTWAKGEGKGRGMDGPAIGSRSPRAASVILQTLHRVVAGEKSDWCRARYQRA